MVVVMVVVVVMVMVNEYAPKAQRAAVAPAAAALSRAL